MFWKFLNHEFQLGKKAVKRESKQAINRIKYTTKRNWNNNKKTIIKNIIVLAAVALGITMLLSPGWLLLLEVIAIVIFLVFIRYLNWKEKNS